MMSRLRLRNIACLVSLLFFVSYFAAEARSEEAIKVTLCQLENDPEAYNHKLIQVTAFVSHGFEDFGLFDPTCSSWSSVWLEYGGNVKSGTMYCCGVTADRKRPNQLVVESIPIPLIDDRVFREFDRLINRFQHSVAHGTIVGRFFAGEKLKYAAKAGWGGYGHLGCCSLLAIQQVLSVDPQDRDDLDYGAPDQPDITGGCNYRLLDVLSFAELIEAQHQAELGKREWSFSDPRRVATETLARLLNIDEKSITGIRQTRKLQGQIVYKWRLKTKPASYVIVVSRPYSLSFYASGTKRVAWVVTAGYELSCE